VYVVDSEGAAISEAIISVSPSVAREPRAPSQSEWQTDWTGMAALGLQPNVRYRILVSASGFHPVELKQWTGRSGELGSITFSMQVKDIGGVIIEQGR
jgi:hypothetical protein